MPNETPTVPRLTSGVTDNVELARFELEARGETAVADYRLSPGVITFVSTRTPPALRNKGVASRLIRGALEMARARGLKVDTHCSFVATYIRRHPEFADLAQ